jgi:alanine-glyoxylate transaminase/serine-glyoxylate transaminase/serine-pyruvate transaminase
MLEEEGLEAAWRRHAVLADSVRAAVEAWSTPGGLELNVTDPAARANSVTMILGGTVDTDRLRAVCFDQAGLTLGIGIGEHEGRGFRIGHMGHLNPPMVLGTLGTVEAALAAISAPTTSSGVAAAASLIGSAMEADTAT